MMTEAVLYTEMESPFGTVVVAGTGGTIRSVRVMTNDGRFGPPSSWQRADDVWPEARSQLRAYFAGTLREFSLPLDPSGTPFQKQAWALLREVPYGRTTTYGEIAEGLGQPNASRAVGGAMNRNPISVIIPCHRVLGKRGSLTGYLNGLDMKRRLLAMEAAHATAPTPQRDAPRH